MNASNSAIRTNEGFAKKIESINKDLESAKKQFGEVSDVLSERGKWTRIVNELQKLIPNKMWLTSIDVAGNSDEIELDAPKRRGLFGSRRSKKRTKTVKKSGVIEWIEISGYTSNRKDLDTLDQRLVAQKNRASKMKTKPVFAGGEKTGGAQTLDSSIVNMNNMKVQKFKIRLKLTEPIK